MSALCHKATFAPQQIVSLFDHLVGARKQRRRHGEAERFRGYEVHHKFEFSRLLHRYFARFCSAQDLVNDFGGTAEKVRIAWPI